MSHAARCEIKSRTALRLGPMHVIGMLVFHELAQCSTKKHSHLGCAAFDWLFSKTCSHRPAAGHHGFAYTAKDDPEAVATANDVLC